jgi:TolB-like protein/tetratricopeptide (TPR) repeat protein
LVSNALDRGIVANFRLSYLLIEARRRRVFRGIGLYIVAAWAVLQATDLLFESWGISSAALRHVWIGAILGFPAALVLAWRYDIAGGQIVRAVSSGVDADLSIRRADYVILAAVTAVAVAIIYTTASDVSDAPVTGPSALASPEVAASSVAVLPFVNMSGDPENEYFSDGLSETLLHMLAQVSELKVSARTSSFAFKGQDQDIRTIASSLGVAHVLEGSVQRAGGRVRITAQLIRADDGFHVWSEHYDRTLDDIFGIQDEIAQLVSASLTTSLLGSGVEQKIEGVGTTSVTAYDLYLKAVSHQAKSSFEALRSAEALLKESLAIDPDFVDAKTQLAVNYFKQVETGLRQPDSAIPEMAALLEQVLESRPKDVRAKAWYLVARVVRANLAGEMIDMDASIEQMRTYTREAPSEVDPKILLAQVVADRNPEEALELMREVLLLDPLNAATHLEVGWIYRILEDWENARQSLERSLQLEPEQPLALDILAAVAQNTGDAVSAVRLGIEAYEIDALDPELPEGNAILLYALGLREQGDQFRDQVLATAPTSTAARKLEIYRAIRFDSRGRQNEIAREMIVDKVGIRARDWHYFALFNNAAVDGSVEDALSFMESSNPGFLDFEQSIPPDLRSARLWSLGALSQIEAPKQIQKRIMQLDYVLNELLSDGGGPLWRLQIRALSGDAEGAVQIALEEIFSRPAIAIASFNFDLYLDQPFLADIAADPRIQNALNEYQVEKSQAAQEVADYLDSLDSH